MQTADRSSRIRTMFSDHQDPRTKHVQFLFIEHRFIILLSLIITPRIIPKPAEHRISSAFQSENRPDHSNAIET